MQNGKVNDEYSCSYVSAAIRSARSSTGGELLRCATGRRRGGCERTATRTVPPADRDYLPGLTYVDRNGTVYCVSVAEMQRTPVGCGWKTPPGWVVDLLRLTGWLGGATLLVGAGRASAT
jgi:hypothetical protein